MRWREENERKFDKRNGEERGRRNREVGRTGEMSEEGERRTEVVKGKKEERGKGKRWKEEHESKG